jgi:hypothetical protein
MKTRTRVATFVVAVAIFTLNHMSVACAAEASVVLGHTDFAPTSARPLGWRGDGSGIYAGAACPTNVNVEKGEGVVWKTSLPAPGNGGVLADRGGVIVTAEPDLVLAFDGDGKEKWRFQGDPTLLVEKDRDAIRADWTKFSQTTIEWLHKKSSDMPPELAAELKTLQNRVAEAGIGIFDSETGWACHTPISDGKTLYASFRHGAVAALDRETGKPIWQVGVGSLGHGSPVLEKGLLLLPGHGAAWSTLALEANTGALVFKQRHPPTKAGGVRQNGAALIPMCLGDRMIAVSACGMAYGLPDGAVLGKDLFNVGVCFDVVGAKDAVYMTIGDDHGKGKQGQGARMVKLALTDGAVTSTQVWESVGFRDKNWPGIAMIPPLLHDGLLYSFLMRGPSAVQVFDAATGERIAGQMPEVQYGPHHFNANPVIVGDKLIQIGNAGHVAIVQSGRDWKEVARFALGETCGSTPAALGKRLYVRSAKTLWCFGE